MITTFEEIYNAKRALLISLLCFYVLIGTFVYLHTDLPVYIKAFGFIAFGFTIFFDGIMSLKQYKEFATLSHDFMNTLHEREKALEHIKVIANGIDPDKLGDSILLTNQTLLEQVRNTDMSGACKSFEVNGEFDAILLLKRKSLPLDEILEILHKSNQL